MENRIVWQSPPGIKTHPFLDIIPMMTEDEFAGLVWSVKKHGLHVPIARDQAGVIIDGRCRLMACIVAGIEPRFKTVEIEDDDAARDYVASVNLYNVYRSPSQKAIARAIEERELTEPDPELSALVLPEAREILEHNEPLAISVLRGNLTLTKAYEELLRQRRERELAAEEFRLKTAVEESFAFEEVRGKDILAREEAFRDRAILAQLCERSPVLAMKVKAGELAIDQAIEAAKKQDLATRADRIRFLGKRVVGDLIEIGGLLTESKADLGHGNWLPWLEQEFGWSDSTALRYMQVYQLSLKFPNLGDLDLPASAIYQLAQPSTPEPIRKEILAMAEHKRIPHAEVRRLIDDARSKRASPGNRFRSDLLDLAERMAEARPDDPLIVELQRLVSGEANAS